MFSLILKNKFYFDFTAYVFFIILSCVNFFYIQVSISSYLIFIFISFLCLKTLLNLNTSYGASVLLIFILLGFWFKFSTVNIFFVSNFGEGIGSFNFLKTSMNEVLMVAVVFKSSLLLAYFISSKVNWVIKFLDLTNIQSFFIKNNVYFNIIILLFVITIIYLNVSNQIFLRGFEFNKDFLFLENLLKFFYKILAPFLIYLLLDISLQSNLLLKKKILAIFFQVMFLSVIFLSQLSREMGIHIIIIIFGMMYYYKKLNIQNFNIIFNSLIISFVFWLTITLITVQFIRNLVLISGIEIELALNSGVELEEALIHFKNSTIALFFNRWIGIDAVMAVSSYVDKGWTLLMDIANNQINWTQNVAWPKNDFFINLTHVNTPGMAAFFYSTGSFIFLFSASFLVFVIFFLIEKFINLISNNFPLTSHFLIFVLAFRLVHLGLGINNLIFFILSIFFLVFSILIINLLLKSK